MVFAFSLWCDVFCFFFFCFLYVFFFFNDTATTEIYTLSLHDALPIFGAGRGLRLMPSTKDSPKCFAQIGDKRILDWTLEAFRCNGITDIVFIGGYQIDKVREEYPELRFYHNDDWANNNILASLMYAEAEMNDEFICCYSDILFTQKVISDLLKVDGDRSEEHTSELQSLVNLVCRLLLEKKNKKKKK